MESSDTQLTAYLPFNRSLMRTVILGLLALVLLGPAQFVYAQGEKDSERDEDSGVRYDSYPHPFSRGALAYSLGDRWDYTDLAYHLDNCPSTIACADAQDAIRSAFQSWAEISALTFTEVDDPRQADIELAWSDQGPELGRVGDVLAYATFPHDGGDVFFDDAEPWSAFDGGSFDLYLVATHEIGHALGLNHSSDPEALMYPTLTPFTQGIAADDAAAIQALYGAPQADKPAQDIPDAAGSEQVSGEIRDDNPYEIWEFDAYAGETLTVTMEAISGDLVPYVGLLTNDEETVLAEGGAAGSVAQVTYTFEQDGTYVIIATREGVEEGYTAGEYLLTITTAETGPQVMPTAGADRVLVDVRSYSPADICEVYISPTGSQDWGQNLLSFTLTNGNMIDVEMPAGVYDVQVVTCEGAPMEAYEVAVTGDLAIEIYEDDINVYVYET